MSVGLRLAAKLPHRESLSGQPQCGVVFDDVMTAVWEASKRVDPVFEGFLAETRVDDELSVQILPGPEPLSFECDGDRLVVTANTTAAGGPGYHVHVVTILDAIAASMGFEWSSDGDDLFDETGYFEDRHYESIESEMIAWFRGVAGVVLGHAQDGATGLCLCLSTDNQPVGDWFAAGPLGPLTQEDLVQVHEGKTEVVVALARRFFPWWDRGATAETLRGIAMTEAWTALLWVPPRNPEERAVCERVLTFFDRAREVDPSIALPDEEIAELRSLLEPEIEWRAPRPDGIGYRRGQVRHALTGGWSLTAPGYLAIDWDDGTWVGASGERTIHATTFSWTGDDGDDGQNFVTHFEDEKAVRQIDAMPGGLHANVWPLTDDRAKTGCGAAVGTVGTGCLLSLFSAIENDGAWAESVVRSLVVRRNEEG